MKRPDRRTSLLTGFFWISFAIVLLPGCSGTGPTAETVKELSPQQRDSAAELLRDTMLRQGEFVKVHAAEYLLSLDHSQGVKELFLDEEADFADEPKKRIGIWRVLAKATYNEERDAWISKIWAVYRDPDAEDRGTAIETLAKLHPPIKGKNSQDAEALNALLEKDMASDDRDLSVGAAWLLAAAGSEKQKRAAFERLRKLLGADKPETRFYAAYALRHLAARGGLPKDVGDALLESIEGETDESAKMHKLTAAAAVAHDRKKTFPKERYDSIKKRLLAYARSETERHRYHALNTLAELALFSDLPVLLESQRDASADVRATAAWAVLRLERRTERGLVFLDWAVIGLYLVGMVAVGVYYSLRVKTTDDYLLGGRNMNALSVGLSLFATLLSTITYLAWPGEIIRFGPMMLAMIAAYPLVFFLAGYFMIPFIMKLRITSAYELLETRLGLPVRMLGSSLFLLMRLTWMAVIIYATTATVLIPLMGLDVAYTPLVCAILGFITIVYTSLGGLRAVVFTDVTQTVILFGGAALTVVLVTIRLGGVAEWLPTAWPTHWPEPVWGFSSTARVTFLGAFLAHFTWWVCTAGSDQMAIQRYLATRDVGSARGVLLTSLLANVVVASLLSIVGLSLLAYFRLNPHLLPDGKSLIDNADSLFPRFIAYGMPAGISGLVVAGLLAAAMSSLSSGVNSSCSVIAVDFVDRFRKNRDESELDHVKIAKYISVAVGVIVVALSAGVVFVSGNLLEVTNKVVNLLTAPLFGLFFMAMFVRRANGTGTLVGAAVGIVVVSLINFWKDLTGSGISFLWAMPASFIAQIGVGVVVSHLTWSEPKKELDALIADSPDEVTGE